MDSVSPQCRELVLPPGFNFSFVLSLLILIGILLSYIPQHIRIIRLRSSFGISPLFVLLGATSGTSAFANVLTLPESARDVACCREISGVSCLAGLLGIFQIGVQCFCFWVILLLFLVYFPRATSTTDPTASASPAAASPAEGAQTSDRDELPSYRSAVFVTIICIVHAAVILVMSIVFAATQPNHLKAWANVLGVMAAILASIQYLPQIWTTFRLQKVGSLSIPMMCIQTPGSLVFVASLAHRYGAEGWSAWGVYAVTAILQGTLLVMGISFEYLGPNKDIIQEPFNPDHSTVDQSSTAGEEERERPSESTPLLQTQQ
ncbi:PQ loop repeat protein [Talaromyces proteolyticus]|uniref:PQ loop repeat protein n=1 Tax=Talaromyces proteolyticus TaxID=1131652 RepID=A0AAD4PZ53_9EURO|nr:PQ loop repeat protein [Talaromyces proteolyticus]KAH8695309.1 PQ loop repeat protein [Talaromyces proteolyticus]